MPRPDPHELMHELYVALATRRLRLNRLPDNDPEVADLDIRVEAILEKLHPFTARIAAAPVDLGGPFTDMLSFGLDREGVLESARLVRPVPSRSLAWPQDERGLEFVASDDAAADGAARETLWERNRRVLSGQQ